MAELPYFKQYVGDHLASDKAYCSLEADGLYLRMRFALHSSSQRGFLVRQGGTPIPDELVALRFGLEVEKFRHLMEELLAAGAFKRTPEGVLYDPQFAHEEDVRTLRSTAGAIGGAKAQAKMKQKRDYDSDYDSEVPESLRSDEFKKAWYDWHVHRLEIGKPLTSQAKAKQLQKLAEWGKLRSINAINRSIAAGWQGIFEQNGSNHKPNNRNAGTYNDGNINDYDSKVIRAVPNAR